MANYLSNYLSAPRRTSIGTTVRYPTIRRASPYAYQNSRATSAIPEESPFAGQDLASNLLYQQNLAKQTKPSTTFDDTYNYDPIQAKIQALGAQSVANAETNASALRNQAAINEGDPDLLRSLGFDENTITAAQNNPESLLSQLNKDYTERQRQLAEAENAQNLYYSGDYQNELLKLATGQGSAQAGLGSKLRDLLGGIDSGVLDAKETARQNDLAQQLADAQNASFQNLLEQLGLLGGSSASRPHGDSYVSTDNTPTDSPGVDWVWDPINQTWIPAGTRPNSGFVFYT